MKFSMSEISKHNSDSDCWIVIQNKVYDLTNYLDKHPGGKRILLKFAGTDCTELFFRIH
ncbi:nitrate reductase NADH 2 [Nosema bombycis CQ1]|uniref:Nitrate reductase NADH 2 n=1 Tax=Nosema bombycis (strain CQ1 / CVCC 102059) TaxID=578461 RepID=R0MJW9_NOSB1|nr:nitrate reductase NADH 2 [Nosema bombycis CQ1]|eukprot:EOB14525.1 nitrate reductase NADH 2 [Nosema bombycis CQ1]